MAVTSAVPTAVRMVIDGRTVEAADGRTSAVVDPAHGDALASVPVGGAEDVDRAVAAAQAALDGPWSRLSAAERGRLIGRLAATVADHAEELAWLESRNVGKPIIGARWEIGAVTRVFDYYAGAPARLTGETIPVAKPGLDLTLREPIGVVGLIVPWNFPLMIASWKLGPALACGNTCVLKPASLTPLTALRLGELALEAGLPPGVLNVVTGPGTAVGAAIAAHPGIGKVAITGETGTGQEVMRLAAGTVKRVSLELGGKSPNICFADADIDRFTEESPMSVFDNAGQDCCARSRILVERRVHDRVVEGFAAATKRLVVGDPADERTQIGSLVSEDHRARVQAYVDEGRDEGARLVMGGTPPADPALAGGAYMEPAVFDGCRPGMRIVDEEVFGPVVAVIPFDDEAEAVHLANATPYGLSGSIWSRDIGRALRVAKGIRSGVLSVNSNSSVHVEAPFGGYGRSGIGRELGRHALDEYSEIKNVYVDLG
jgi:betaine-aldehyde dehydrogenase